MLKEAFIHACKVPTDIVSNRPAFLRHFTAQFAISIDFPLLVSKKQAGL